MSNWHHGKVTIREKHDYEYKVARLSGEPDIILVRPSPGPEYRFEVLNDGIVKFREAETVGNNVHHPDSLEAVIYYLLTQKKRVKRILDTEGNMLGELRVGTLNSVTEVHPSDSN